MTDTQLSFFFFYTCMYFAFPGVYRIVCSESFTFYIFLSL